MFELNMEAERAAFEAWHCNKFKTKHSTGHPTRDMHNGIYAKNYGPEKQQQMWEAWQAARRTAPVSAPLDTQALPPLPKPMVSTRHGTPCYTVGQMMDHTRDAIAPYAARIAHLERELAERKPVSIEPERMNTDESREYLVKFMEQHFTDKTYHRYIRGERGSVNLAGDFAWQMARALRIIDGYPLGKAGEGRAEQLERQVQALLNHCPDPECFTCGAAICPHGEPLHFHHDGCPACAQAEDAAPSPQSKQEEAKP